MAQRGRQLQQLCTCRFKLYALKKKKTREQCKRKRQAFVYNPEEEIWHEPYMQTVRREFSDVSVPCDSKIELPWRDIALPTAGMKIRPDVILTADRADPKTAERVTEVAEAGVAVEKRESTMTLPWRDLLITETLRSDLDARTCDSSVEIPWNDLALEKPLEIKRKEEEEVPCTPDDVEIPWDEILVPRNIVIKPARKRRHPSSGRPPRAQIDAMCATCGTYPCCAKTRAGIRATCTTTCM